MNLKFIYFVFHNGFSFNLGEFIEESKSIIFDKSILSFENV